MGRVRRLRVWVSPVLLAAVTALGRAWPAAADGWTVHVTEASAAAAVSRYHLVLDGEFARIDGDGVERAARSLAGLERIAILGSPGGDTLAVDLRGALPALEIDYDGGAGFDALEITGSARLDSVTYAPGPGNDEGLLTYRAADRALSIRFRGLEPVKDDTSVTTLILDAFSGVGNANTITYSAGGSGCATGTDATWGKLQIDALECFEFKNKGTIDIRAGDGADTFHLLNASRPTGLTQIIARGGSGADAFNLRAAASGVATTLGGEADSDSFHVSSLAPTLGGSLDGIVGNVTIEGGAHGSGVSLGLEIKGVLYSVEVGDYLLIEDLADPDPSTYALSDASVSRTGTGTITYSTIESIQLFAGLAGATVNVTGTPSGSWVSVVTGSSADTVTVTATGADSIVDIDTGGGADFVTIASTGGEGANGDGLGAFLRASAGAGADQLVLAGTGNASRTKIGGGDGADSVEIRTTATSSVVVAEGGAGNDSFVLGSSDSLDGILGSVCIDGGGHDPVPTRTLEINGDTAVLPIGDLVELRDLADPDANHYQIGAVAIDRSGAGSIEYLATETLSVLSGSAANSFTVFTTPAATSTLLQGSPQADSLSVFDTGADSLMIADLLGGADLFVLSDAGADGGDADAFGAFVWASGGSGSDVFDYLGAPALVVGGGASGVLLPPDGQRIEYASFEDAAYNPDFGDAPDVYGTLQSSNGPRHGGGGSLRLGAAWDAEPDGAPNDGATGDGADEDGIVFTTPIELGADSVAASLTVTSSGVGRVDAWIDFNHDGAFGAGEQILVNSMVASGANPRSFTSYAAALPGATYARFRLSSAGGLSATGPAVDGEVEDYQVVVKPVDVLDLMNRWESTTRSFWACNSILVGEPGDPFRVVTGGDITLRAGALVTLRNDVAVEDAAALAMVTGGVPGCP